MSEITKLYENAGIKGEWRDYRVKNGKIYDGKNPKNRNIRLCTPRFTAEKQIAILQLLARRYDLTISHYTGWEFRYYDGEEPLEITGKDFTETFAKLISVYWQSLTEEEKQEIKEILE